MMLRIMQVVILMSLLLENTIIGFKIQMDASSVAKLQSNRIQVHYYY